MINNTTSATAVPATASTVPATAATATMNTVNTADNAANPGTPSPVVKPTGIKPTVIRKLPVVTSPFPAGSGSFGSGGSGSGNISISIGGASGGSSGGAGGNGSPLLRVAAYCRVSTDSEEQSNSFSGQVNAYTSLIKANPAWTLAEIYADDGITGTSAQKRPRFMQMISDCEAGKIDLYSVVKINNL